ncbi:MAG TPA: metal-binding protein [Clostridiales bacterium UBA8153]|nr:metal-binding protein [Clostridiales bacterium UBA8153]
MRVHVANLLEATAHTLEVAGRLDLGCLDGPGVPTVLATAVEVRAKLSATGRGVLVVGEAGTVGVWECSRCLVRYEHPLAARFSVEFRPPGEETPEDGPDGREVQTFTGQWVDLLEVIRQSLILDMPMKPLCREDCLGLCQECGGNLNQGSCPCARGGDPRWQALGRLLDPK